MDVDAISEIKPPRLRYAEQAYEITGPIIVHSRADIASLLRAHRMARGMTCLAHDHQAGFHDGYTAKLEHGDARSGKRGFHFREPGPDDGGSVAMSGMAEVWLESLGLQLVLLPAELARSIGAVPAPRKQSPADAR